MIAGKRVLRWTPILLVGFALAVRLVSLVLTTGTPLAGDEREYFVLAASLAAGDPLSPMGDRPPLIPAFFGGLLAVSGGSLQAVRLGNAVVGALLVLPVYALGSALGGRRTALAAAVLAALYPSFVASSHGLWSEALYMSVAFTALSLLALDEGGGDVRSLARLSLAGALLGASALIREVGAIFPALAAAWLLTRAADRQRRLLRPAVLLSTAAVVVLPWTVYLNGHVDYGLGTGFDRGAAPYALISRTTWQNMYIGNSRPRKIVDRSGRERRIAPKKHYYTLGQTRLQTEAVARLFALESIAERLPWWPFEKVASEMPKLFAPTSIAQVRLLAPSKNRENEWSYRLRFAPLDRPGARRVAAMLIALAYAAVAISGIGGLMAIRNRRLASLLGLFLASQMLPSIVAFGSSRFRLPLMGVLLLGTAYASTHTRRLRELPPLHLIAILAAVVIVAALIGSRWDAALSPRWG